MNTGFLVLNTLASANNGIGPSGLTWEFLGTMAGAVSATTLIVQFIKIPLDKVWRIPTRFIVYFISFFILVAVDGVSGTLTPERFLLAALNAIIVAMAAMGTYENTFKKIEHSKDGT